MHSPAAVNVPRRAALFLWLRYLSSVSLLLISFTAAMLFYGPGYNLLFAWISSAACVATIMLGGPERFFWAARAHPVAISFAALSILLLALQHSLFAESAEISFPVVWVLASAPLWCMALLIWSTGVPLSLARWPVPPHFLALGLLVAILAILAFTRFVVWDVRPHDPLVDASGFGILVYLIWVPAVHWWLVRAESVALFGDKHARIVDAGYLLGAFVVLTAIFATASVACTGLIAAVLAAWAILAMRGKLCWRRVLSLIAVALSAYSFTYAQSPAFQESMDSELAEDGATEQRILLVKAALQLIESGSMNGSGLFSFASRYAGVRSTLDQTSDGSFVHNDYLQLLVEGGLWLFIPLVAFGLLVAARSLSYLTPMRVPFCPSLSSSEALRAGGWFALGMICVHMLVNFVLYTMALAICVGAVAAWACSGERSSDSTRRTNLRLRGKAWIATWLLASGFGIYGLGLFALDVMSASVFSGQPSLFGSANYRSSGAAQLTFARRASALNSDRGTPVLFQALYAKAMAERSNTDQRQEQFARAAEKFDDALELDPWNLNVYIGYAELLRNTEAVAYLQRSPQSAGSGRTNLELLEAALVLEPRSLAVLGAIAELPLYRDDPEALYQLLQLRFYPWLLSHWRKSRAETDYWLNRMAALSIQLDDQAFLQRLREDRAALGAKPAPESHKAWFIEWQQQRARG